MKNKKFSFILTLCLLLQIAVMVIPAGAVETTMEKATALHELGLFAGTDQGFQLDRAPNRLEGIVMFVRMMGAEKEALAESNAHPFTDVPEWAGPYVGYAYVNGLTNGVSATQFGSARNMSVSEYVTLLLRVLGYSDSLGDFSWNTALEKAVEIQMFTAGQADDLRKDEATRGRMVYISWAALTQPFKGESVYTLTRFLVEKSVFTEAQARKYGLWNETAKPYLVDTLIRANIQSKWHMTLDGTDGLIYYDQAKGAIYRIDLSEGKREEPVQLFDVKNASVSVEIDGAATIYKDLNIRQIFADDVNQRLLVVGKFSSIDVEANDGWTNTSAPAEYGGCFSLRDGALQLLTPYAARYIFSVLQDGRYANGYEFDSEYLYISSIDDGSETKLQALYGDTQAMGQVKGLLYRVTYGNLYQYDFADIFWKHVGTLGSSQAYCANGLFYGWCESGEIRAMRPNGQQKTLVSFSDDAEVRDAAALPKYVSFLVTTDESFVFYDSTAKAIRMIYKNPDA